MSDSPKCQYMFPGVGMCEDLENDPIHLADDVHRSQYPNTHHAFVPPAEPSTPTQPKCRNCGMFKALHENWRWCVLKELPKCSFFIPDDEPQASKNVPEPSAPEPCDGKHGEPPCTSPACWMLYPEPAVEAPADGFEIAYRSIQQSHRLEVGDLYATIHSLQQQVADLTHANGSVALDNADLTRDKVEAVRHIRALISVIEQPMSYDKQKQLRDAAWEFLREEGK